jgi:hypothetical protein
MAIVRIVRDTGARWNTTDFTRYYMETYRRLHNKPEYEFPDRAWAMYGTHIRRFIRKYKLSSQAYKTFLDWVFSDDFLCGRKNLGFLCTVDADVYQLFIRLQKRRSAYVIRPITDEDEQQLRTRIHASKSLFPED